MLAANSVARYEVANTLSGINAEKPQMAERQYLKGYLNANQRSHVTLYAVANNPELLNMIDFLWIWHGPLMNTVRSDILSRTGANHNWSTKPSPRCMPISQMHLKQSDRR